MIDNKIHHRANFAGVERNKNYRFSRPDGQIKAFNNANAILTCGPVIMAPHDIPMKGFQGFRYLMTGIFLKKPMSKSKIQWTDRTWNPVTSYTKVSQGCKNCYAERLYERFHGHGSFKNVLTHPERLQQPLNRKPAKSL